MKEIILLICMLTMSIEDVRYKSIPVWQVGTMLLVFVIYMLYFHDFGMENVLIGVTVGTLLLAICRMTGWLGVGDGIVIGIICVFMGWLFAAQIFIMAITLMSLTSMILLTFKIVKIKYEMPFIPYLFVSAVGVLACG